MVYNKFYKRNFPINDNKYKDLDELDLELLKYIPNFKTAKQIWLELYQNNRKLDEKFVYKSLRRLKMRKLITEIYTNEFSLSLDEEARNNYKKLEE